jgi:hypothetical protein
MHSKIGAIGLVLPGLAAVAARAQPQHHPNTLRLSPPGQPGALVVELPGFTVAVNALQPDGRRYRLATNRHTGVTLSVYLERMAYPRASTDCPEHMQALAQGHGPFQKVGIRITGSRRRAHLEYVGIPRVKGFEEVKTKHLHACVATAEVYADLHFSTVVRDPREDDRLAAILRTVRFES